MANIKTIIKNIVENDLGSPVPTFRYGWKAFQNLKADKENVFPLVYLHAPISASDSLKSSGLIESEFSLELFFGDKTKIDYTPEQHDVIIQEMRTLSTKFIQECQKDTAIHFVKNCKRSEAINIFDLNLSGIILEITIIPFNADSFC